jgi:NAD(P)-dependent dehydrogenase (short-subunit alcohol dehydrogenase family)
MAKTWLITGSSRGFGWELAKAVLEDGDKVVATARRPELLDDLVRQYGDRVRTCALDVTDAAAAGAAVKLAVDAFGSLDVVVNNAGYASFASIEDMPDDAFRSQIEANLFGVVNVTKAALPVLRKQRAGHFIQFSSIGGRVGGTPGLSAYQTAKFAVEGFSEVLNNEVKPLGIKVTIIEPGAFRTDWGGPTTRTMPVSEDYEQTVGAMIRSRDATDGKQPGDPARAASLIIGIARLDEPPLRLLLGAGAVESAEKAAGARAAEVAEWAVVSRAADFGAAAPSEPYRVRLAAAVTG